MSSTQRPCGSFRVEFWAKSFRLHGVRSGSVSPVIYSGLDLSDRKNQDVLLDQLPLLLETVVQEVVAAQDYAQRMALGHAIGRPAA